MTYFGTFSFSKGSHSFLFKSKFILYYWKPGTQACQTSKVLSILHGVRFNLATEKSNRDGAPESRAIKVVRDVFTRTGFSFRPPKTEISQWGLSSNSARQGREMLPWNQFDVCPHPSGHRCCTTVWEQQGCQLWFYTSLLFLNKKFSRSYVPPEAKIVLCWH